MKRITRARDQAKRLRRTDTGTQVTERTEKILQRVKEDGVEFPQFPNQPLVNLKIRRQG